MRPGLIWNSFSEPPFRFIPHPVFEIISQQNEIVSGNYEGVLTGLILSPGFSRFSKDFRWRDNIATLTLTTHCEGKYKSVVAEAVYSARP